MTLPPSRPRSSLQLGPRRARPFAACVLALIMALIIALPAHADSAKTPDGEITPAAPRPVVSEMVSLQSNLTLGWVGTVTAPREIDLGFARIGTVAERRVRVGDRVEKGDVLAMQDPADLDTSLRAARAGVDIARAQWKTAQDARDRTMQLVERGVDSTASAESARNRLAAAQAQLEQAEATLAQAQDGRDHAALTAPQDGVITAVYAEAGATLSAGEPLVKLAAIDAREVLLDLTEEDVAALAIGTDFNIELEANNAITARARLTSVDAVATRATRTRSVHLTLADDAPASFRLGALVTARLSAASQAVTILPHSAVIANAAPPAVWRIDPATRALHRQQVQIGGQAHGYVLVLTGISVGDEILTKGVNSVTQGQIVGTRIPQ